MEASKYKVRLLWKSWSPQDIKLLKNTTYKTPIWPLLCYFYFSRVWYFFPNMTLCNKFLLLNSEAAVNTKELFSQPKKQHVSHQHSSTAEESALRHCPILGTTLLPSLLLQTVLIFERATLISHFILSSSNEQNSYMAGMLSPMAYYSLLKIH